MATDEDAILRRDIYDRSPIFSWGKGRVTLLGDSVHAMQPNLGQGGCMAIEVKFILTQRYLKIWSVNTATFLSIFITYPFMLVSTGSYLILRVYVKKM